MVSSLMRRETRVSIKRDTAESLEANTHKRAKKHGDRERNNDQREGNALGVPRMGESLIKNGCRRWGFSLGLLFYHTPHGEKLLMLGADMMMWGGEGNLLCVIRVLEF